MTHKPLLALARLMARRQLLAGSMGLGAAAMLPAGAAAADDASMPDDSFALWPAGHLTPPPGLAEHVVERSADPTIRDRALVGIATPRVDVFCPARPNGAAVMIAPGGGYKWVVIDKEGYEFARWLNGRGVTAYVCFYRLPGDGWSPNADVPLIDAQRAMRLIRARAAIDGIDPARLVAAGFSAGGHVCASLLTRFAEAAYAPVDAADTLSARPAAAAPIYPVQSMEAGIAHPGSRERLLGPAPTADQERRHSPDCNVPVDAPPCFLLHAEDDDVVPVANTLRLRAALKAQGIACETHVFERGGHGFGLRFARGKPVEAWPELLLAWMKAHGLA